MPWYKNSNGESVKPVALDTTSSKKWNYVRKDFSLITATEDFSEHWEWQELKIAKEQYDSWLAQQQDRADIDYLLMITEEE